MGFAAWLAWREMRASWKRLSFFFLCVAIGVAAIIALRSVIQDVRGVMTGEARGVIAGDIVIDSPRAFDAATRASIDAVLGGAPAVARSSAIQTFTMMRPAGDDAGVARMAEVRGVDAAYPLYGALTLASGRAYTHDLIAGDGAIVQPEVLAQLGLRVGDPIVIAGHRFDIRDVLTSESAQRRGGVSFGPRIYVDIDALRQLPVLGVGARARFSLMLKLDAAAVTRVDTQLAAALKSQPVSVLSWQRLDDRIGRAFGVGENYLSLVGFVIVVLGGIGVWSVAQVFVQQKLKTIAVLKCLGASSRQVLLAYVWQIAALAVAGAGLGTGVAALAVAAIPAAALATLQLDAVHLTASAIAQGSAVGILISLLFALVPLLEIRAVKPLLLLRADTATRARRRDLRSIGVFALLAAAVIAVAAWQAGSWRAGVWATVGVAGAAAACHALARGLAAMVRPLTRSRRFVVRHAALSVSRPGSQLQIALVAVGLGALFVLGMRMIQANLLAEFAPATGGVPDLVLIDVQTDQADALSAIVARYTSEAPKMLPLMRARVTGVDGRRVHLESLREVQDYDAGLAREFGLTFRLALDANERVVAGHWWDSPLPSDGPPDQAEVSIEQNFHQAQKIDIGDVLRFDIAGRPVRARVTSIRDVQWDNVASGGFVFVFRPGPIARVPHSLVTFIGGMPDPDVRGRFQRDVATTLPNVSAIDVRDILKGVQAILANVTLAVTIVGAVLAASGLLILAGAVAMTKFQRVYAAAIYRTLGAGTRTLVAMALLEYGLIGAIAGVMAAAGAVALSIGVSEWLLEIEWRVPVELLAAGVVSTAMIAAVVGVTAGIDVFLTKPLQTLRRE